MRKQYKYTILSILCFHLLTSCEKDDELKPQLPSDFKVEAIDKSLFEHINTANNLSSKDKLWRGYQFTEFPMYFVFRDDKEVAKRAYLVNPIGTIKNAIKLNKEDSKGINVYSYDDAMLKVNELIKKGNGAYDMDVSIADGKYYVQVYDEKATKENDTQPIMLAIHEVFHQFQMDWNTDSSLQDENNYPLTKALMPFQLMTIDMAKKVPNLTDKAEIKKYLSMYVAIRSKEMELDPSKDKLVTNMANWQENAEGTAKYVEYMLGQNIFNDYPKTFENGNSKQIQSREQMRGYFAWGIWYGTGAAAVYMLKQLDVDVEKLVKDGKTLYGIADEHLQLTPAQKDRFLYQAQQAFDWREKEDEAKRLLEL